MRWLGRLSRLVGWLLTPLVAWAASFFGAWLVLVLAGRHGSSRLLLLLLLAGGLVTAVATLLIWMRFLRASPRLRHTLHVDPEGLPLTEAAEAAAGAGTEESPEREEQSVP